MICSKAKLPMKSTISKLNMCYNQTCDISTLDGTSLKLVDTFTYLESSKCALYLLRANVHSVVGPGRLCSCILRRYFVLFFSDTAEGNDKYQIAYDKLKGMLAEKVTLAYSDLTRAYNLSTDASDYAIGAFLTQTLYYEDKGKEQGNPIYFLSHKLSDTQTEKDIDTRLTKACTAIDRPSIIWKSDLTDKMKRSFRYVLTFWPGQKCHSRWCTGRKWHILMAVMRGNRVGGNWLMKWDELKKFPWYTTEGFTGREWSLNCMTVISAWWRLNIRFQRSSGRRTII